MAQMASTGKNQANQSANCACHHRTLGHCNLHLPPFNRPFYTDLWSSWLGRRPPDPKVTGSIPGECILNGSTGLNWQEPSNELQLRLLEREWDLPLQLTAPTLLIRPFVRTCGLVG